MDQRWIFGSMLTAGIGLFGVVAWIQSDRYAFTSTHEAPSGEAIQRVISEAKPAWIVPDGPVMEMPEVEIVGRRRTPVVAPPPAPERELNPCSNWEELGPIHVDDGVPSGVRRWRKLC